MSTKPAPISAFECPICSHLEKDEQKYEKHYSKCLEEKRKEDKEEKLLKERDKNSRIILEEAECIDDIRDLYEKYAKEFFNCDLKFSMFSLSFKEDIVYWRAGKDPKPGFVGRIEGTFKGKRKGGYDAYFTDIIDGSFGDFPFHLKGLVTGTGGSGGPGTKFGYEAHIFIDQFPKIKKKFDAYKKEEKEFQKLEADHKEYEQAKEKLKKDHNEIFVKTCQENKELLEYANKILEYSQKHVKKKQEIQNSLDEIWNRMVDGLQNKLKFDEEHYESERQRVTDFRSKIG